MGACLFGGRCRLFQSGLFQRSWPGSENAFDPADFLRRKIRPPGCASHLIGTPAQQGHCPAHVVRIHSHLPFPHPQTKSAPFRQAEKRSDTAKHIPAKIRRRHNHPRSLVEQIFPYRLHSSSPKTTTRSHTAGLLTYDAGHTPLKSRLLRPRELPAAQWLLAFSTSNTVMAVVPDSNRLPFSSTQSTTFQTVCLGGYNYTIVVLF